VLAASIFHYGEFTVGRPSRRHSCFFGACTGDGAWQVAEPVLKDPNPSTSKEMTSNDSLAAWRPLLKAASPPTVATPNASYVARLLHKGPDAFLKKIGEEATEVVMAAKDAGPRRRPRKSWWARWPTCGFIP
jgi:hypothetical protein